jgi:hypothetical protein
MEVYLSKDVLESFSALRLLLADSSADGILIGHKRGHMFFVERILPSQRSFFSSEEKFLSLNKQLDHRILGFYSFKTDQRKIKKILAPFAYGKIFLQMFIDRKDRLEIKPFVIEHEKDFHLSPIKFRSDRQRTDQWIIP